LRSPENIPLQQSVVKTLLYFDIFRYPLKTEEIYKFLRSNTIADIDLQNALETLVHKGCAFRHFDFYSVQQDQDLVARRLNGNRNAQKLMAFAKQRAKLIGRFPFVQGVMASGSFSKGYMDENSDLDFFVITATGRLWIARTMIALFKRIFFLNSHKYFCCNYFIDVDHLEIGEKNLFTATELATLLPLYGASIYQRLIQANSWTTRFFPNFKPHPVEDVPENTAYFPKSFMEYFLRGLTGERMEIYFMGLALKRWKNQYGRKYALVDFDIAFKTSRHVSKNHPNHFQRKILERYREKVNDFNKNNCGILELPDL
jgi:hypothetical protein